MRIDLKFKINRLMTIKWHDKRCSNLNTFLVVIKLIDRSVKELIDK